MKELFPSKPHTRKTLVPCPANQTAAQEEARLSSWTRDRDVNITSALLA